MMTTTAKHPQSLKTQGYRFLIHLSEASTAKWVHPTELGDYPGYKDVTDMTDEEFEIFMIDNFFPSIRYTQ